MSITYLDYIFTFLAQKTEQRKGHTLDTVVEKKYENGGQKIVLLKNQSFLKKFQ